MENKDTSITNILVDTENSINNDDFKPNPFQNDIINKRSKSKAKQDFNKFLFNTAQLKINKKLTINNQKSKINKFEYIDKKSLLPEEEKENVDNVIIPNDADNINKGEEMFFSNNEIDDSMTEYKDASEHYSVIIPDDSEIIENNYNTESNKSKTKKILDNTIHTSMNNDEKINKEDMFKRNDVNSKRIETLMNSLGNMNENVKKRIISHISNNTSTTNNDYSTSIRQSSTYESLLKKYHNVNQISSNNLKEQNSQSTLKNNKTDDDIIEIKEEANFHSNIPLNKSYKTLTKKHSDSNIDNSFSSLNKARYKKYNGYMKHQSLPASLITRRTSIVQDNIDDSSPQNNINIANDLDNENLTLNDSNLNSNTNDIKFSKTIKEENNIDHNNLLFKTPSNNYKYRNLLLSVQNKNDILKHNFTKSLDRGKTSYMQFLNDETILNKKDSDTQSISLKYENFLKSPINTPSKISEMLTSNQDTSSSTLLSIQNYKLPTTAYSANSFFEKSKKSYTKINDKINNLNQSPLLPKSLHERDELLALHTDSSKSKYEMDYEIINENENLLKENLIKGKMVEENLNTQNNIEDSTINNKDISLKLGFYSPLLNNENNHQRNLSETSQSTSSRLNVNSPTSENEENNISVQLESYSRKRPSDTNEKNEIDQSLIILSDSSSQNKSEKKIHYSNNNEISNKKSKIKSSGNSILDSQSSISKPNNSNVYTESQIDEIKRILTEKYEKQLKDAKKDCMEWEQKCIESKNKHREIESVLEEYEITITRMIKDSQKEKERQELRINELLEERSYLQESSEIMETSFKELRLKFEEFKTQNEIFSKNEDLMKQTITSLQNDVLLASQRYEQIKTHAEEKLEMANIEIAKVRNNFDKELSAMKAKLLRKELDSQSLNQKIKALQEQISIKTKENEELAIICDSLVSKLEN
ncbi:TACC-domain-containing protein [Piromyces finnis]|uniref:TACC-domain-containing protein n=1 Tax=Piromyces finnis TaxID=1754191 RepID=A0A1Y1V3Y5_9FUNG|nr:TACC-domain-containing protein [Piromyces finnis]|eukprot:ORX45961.1 TACC-domain-containing protein [Piromyces finnis]